MRLSEFIARDMNAILGAWDTFARAQLPAADQLDTVMLRDHAQEILNAMIRDLQTPQSADEQHEKSVGRAPRIADALATAAETHGFLRAKWGFDIKQLLAEFRALRASVLYLWAAESKPSPAHTEDMMRFNEAIDQAIAESVAFFNTKLTNERNLLLGALGHDMRSPLHVIHMSVASLKKLDAEENVIAIAARIAQSSAQLKSLLDDLVDFNRTNLGLGLSISPRHCDLAQLFGEALEQLKAGHPGREIELEVTGNVKGTWDPNRLHQLLSNLVINALKYGSRLAAVRVVLAGRPAEVEFSVHNQGPKIDESLARHIFEPLVRGNENRSATADSSLGLGLYIASQIAHAHGGNIAVRSHVETVFTVRLPRLTSSLELHGSSRANSRSEWICEFWETAGRALTVCEICALSNLDNISVGIADVAARLAVLGDRLRDELRSATFPQFIARLNVRNAEIHKAVDVIRVGDA